MQTESNIGLTDDLAEAAISMLRARSIDESHMPPNRSARKRTRPTAVPAATRHHEGCREAEGQQSIQRP